MARTKDTLTNEVANPQPPTGLDANLKRALLKALAELEDDDGRNGTEFRNRIFEKAPASAVSFISGPSMSTATTSTTEGPDTSERSVVVVQKSDGVQHRTIFSVVPGNETEQILTSASSSFTSSEKFSQSEGQCVNREC